MSEASAIRELTREECDALLVRNHVGRIAYSHRDRVDIEPISYVYAEGWIYGRTSQGSKLRTLAHNRWVAFETDEVQAMYLWRSVVVKGALYLLEKIGASSDAWSAAVSLLRPVMPICSSQAIRRRNERNSSAFMPTGSQDAVPVVRSNPATRAGNSGRPPRISRM